MKKYLILILVFISFAAFGAEKDSVHLGEVENSRSPNDCNAPQIKGCGPCFKLCMQQFGGERQPKPETASSTTPVRARGASGSDQ